MNDQSFGDRCKFLNDDTGKLYPFIAVWEMLWGTHQPKTLANKLLRYLLVGSLVLSCVLGPIMIEIVFSETISLVSLIWSLCMAMIVFTFRYSFNRLVAPLNELRAVATQLGVYADYHVEWQPHHLHITDDALSAESIAACITHFPLASHLDLSDTATTDAMVPWLLGFKMMRTLDLSRTKVTDKAITALKVAENLQCLNVDSTAITDRALKEMENMPSLRLVYAKAVGVTENGISALREVRPSLTLFV
jgi:hypothetical protein